MCGGWFSGWGGGGHSNVLAAAFLPLRRHMGVMCGGGGFRGGVGWGHDNILAAVFLHVRRHTDVMCGGGGFRVGWGEGIITFWPLRSFLGGGAGDTRAYTWHWKKGPCGVLRCSDPI